MAVACNMKGDWKQAEELLKKADANKASMQKLPE